MRWSGLFIHPYVQHDELFVTFFLHQDSDTVYSDAVSTPFKANNFVSKSAVEI